MKLLITSPAFGQPHMTPLIEAAKGKADEVVINPYGRTMTIEEVKELWEGVDAIVAGLEPYTADVLANAPSSLKAICRFGVGYDSVDVAAAKAKNIAVTNTPGTNSDAVADLAIGMMIAIARHIPQGDKSVRDGSWNRYTGLSMEGKKLGILGLGAIGKNVAKRAAGFSMDIYAYDPYFDQETLGKMKPTAYLINAARGPLVNEDDLYDALKNNRIMGAALDVYSQEPLKDSPLFQLDNVVLLPHIGGNTREAATAMGRLAIDNALAIVNGEECRYIVNR